VKTVALVAALTSAAAVSTAAVARADEPAVVVVDTPHNQTGTLAPATDWHPYVFSIEAPTLSAHRAAVETGLGYNGVTGAGGGLQPDDYRRMQWWLTGAIGVVDRFQIQGTLVGAEDPTNGFTFSQMHAEGMALILKARRRFPVSISAGVGYQLDAVYDSAVTGVVAVSADFGRLNLVLDVRAAHYFAPGRDPVDVFVTTGALIRATRWLRVGAEYVGEELEGLFGDDDADMSQGGRHYVGPTAVLQFLGGKLRLNATGGAVFAQGKAGGLARGGIAWLF
jgi:hypothetical protein